ncbi:helix-turn-helix domain-containing protein [Enterobacter bugandensis]|uniref:helix-turn-helix domain-containing protein n=1 Tax=Enterobacter bugandensis TaxID=881260 RepID=UPI00131F2FC9|nr:helix-turn-helix domain-containing protein [Enterobacter bugandensis]QWZ48830.1 helix-turn-helix domain-containing protein [Enterobacter bugandensis]UBH41097.1 helix-turn-helix domain-containing protein [Enterobacter bugandensis]UBH92803.1 helix-turn-helix domain-containing protein [Enterobacter bugandensis]UBH99409.1 helix-turn-helix domain-containing protein [Enterobacter bugandensis]
MKTIASDNDEFEHPFSFFIGTKPIKAIEDIYRNLLPFGEENIIARGRCLDLESPKYGGGVFLIQHGLLSCCSAESNIIKGTYLSPSIAGLVDAYSCFYDIPGRVRHYYYAETEVIGFFIPLKRFVDIIDSNAVLWHQIARILAHRLMTISSRDSTFLDGDSYMAIKSLLEEIYFYPEQYRRQIYIANYIMKRTGISRSRIMKILLDLKLGGYIDVSHGRLVSLSKLPSRY